MKIQKVNFNNKKFLIFLIAFIFIITAIVLFSVAFFLNPVTEIYIKNLPKKLYYYESEEFDNNGLLVCSKYQYFGIEKNIENYKIIVDNPLLVSSQTVKIIYENSGKQFETSLNIFVEPRKIVNMQIIQNPTKTTYYEGDYFDFSGIKLQVNCVGDVKSFEPNNITFDKQNIPLSVNDKQIKIYYSENNKTVFAVVDIIVKEKTKNDELVLQVTNLIEFLPNVDDLNLNDENLVNYVQSIVDNLTEEQKTQIDITKLEKLNEKIKQLKKEQEIIQNKEYNISYKLVDIEAEIDFNNITKYKNIDGSIRLNEPISKELYNYGYDFIEWRNEDGKNITKIENISKDTTFYAVYQLSQKINLKFLYNSEEIGVISVNRYNGVNYKYSLSNNEISNFIFEKIAKIPTKYIVNNIELTEIDTKNNREISIEVVAQSPQDIVEDNIVMPQNNSVIFVKGNSVNEFILSDGFLTENDLSDIYYLFNEQNYNYINYYFVSGNVKTYDDLLNINFGQEKSNIVVVTQNENKFNLTINYSGGQKIFYGLIGRQKIIDALKQFANEDNQTINLVNELSQRFNFEQTLYKNIDFNFKERTDFEINLHIDEEISTIDVPNFSQQDFKLTNYLPKPKKLGFVFMGWVNEVDGQILDSEFLNIITQNCNTNTNLYAIWEHDPNYKKPDTMVEYNQNFVSEWTAEFERCGVIVNASLILEKNGVYTYKISNNGIETISVFGDYRYENNEIVFYNIQSSDDYNYLEKKDLDIDLTFVEDNILVVNCFLVLKNDTVVNIESFEVVLNKDNIKFENYYGNKLTGTYKIEVLDILTNTLDSYIIELVNNGSAIITFNGVTEYAYYRILNDKVILLSNGFIGVEDITDYILESNRI